MEPKKIKINKILSILEDFMNKFLTWKTVSNKTPFSDEYVLLKPFGLKSSILKSTYELAIIENAFTHMFRFLYAIKFNCFDNDSIAVMDAHFGYQMYQRIGPKILSEKMSFVDFQAVTDMYHDCLQFLKKLITKTIMIDDHSNLKQLARWCVFLARLDYLYTNNYPKYTHFAKITKINQYVNELIDLINIANPLIFESPIFNQSKILYKPYLGIGSRVLFSVDANMVINNATIEISTDEDYGLNKTKVVKLIAQYLALQLTKTAPPELKKINPLKISNGLFNSYQNLKINKLIFYRARFGEMEYADLSKIKTKQIDYHLYQISKWWMQYIHKQKSKLAKIEQSKKNDSEASKELLS